jgi:hypothetical protein
VVSFMPPPLYPQGKGPRYPLDRGLGGPQSRSGRCGEEKNSQPPYSAWWNDRMRTSDIKPDDQSAGLYSKTLNVSMWPRGTNSARKKNTLWRKH